MDRRVGLGWAWVMGSVPERGGSCLPPPGGAEPLPTPWKDSLFSLYCHIMDGSVPFPRGPAYALVTNSVFVPTPGSESWSEQQGSPGQGRRDAGPEPDTADCRGRGAQSPPQHIGKITF